SRELVSIKPRSRHGISRSKNHDPPSEAFMYPLLVKFDKGHDLRRDLPDIAMSDYHCARPWFQDTTYFFQCLGIEQVHTCRHNCNRLTIGEIGNNGIYNMAFHRNSAC